MKTEQQRGPIGAWLVRSRKERNLSVDQLADAASDDGYRFSTASLRGIEAGRWRPGAEILARLEKALGSTAPNEEEAPPPRWATELLDEIRAVRQRVSESRADDQRAAVQVVLEELGLLPVKAPRAPGKGGRSAGGSGAGSSRSR